MVFYLFHVERLKHVGVTDTRPCVQTRRGTNLKMKPLAGC